jgi:hypothetical protein
LLAAFTAAAIALALVLVAGGSPASADGDGSPSVCQTELQASGDGDLQTFTADDGKIVDGVCIKAGQLHTGVLSDGLYEDECYEVSGVGTQTVVVERVGEAGRECQEISHVDVLVTDEPPEPGKIVVVKEVTEGSATDKSFVFTASYDGDGFSLSDGQSNDSGDLTAGTYSVSETVPTGWTLLLATCDGDSTPADINVEAGETVTCTFVNHEIPDEIQPGKIIVKKEVTVGDMSKVFTFTESGFTLDDNTLAHGEMGMSGDVEPGGDYSVSESVPEGWTLLPATCDDANSTPADINVEEGETVTCTFVNIEDEVSQTTIVSTPTTIVSTTVEVSADTLPFTGFENGTSGLLALMLVASGALALVGTRVFRKETDE